MSKTEVISVAENWVKYKIFWAKLWTDSRSKSFNLITAHCKICFMLHDRNEITFILHPTFTLLTPPQGNSFSMLLYVGRETLM